MKIKTVCEMTDLTARAVRVYIDEQLIAPSFTENYLGRRNFDFSEDDVKTLKSIAVLRKNDFSIDEIREIINNSENSVVIVQNVKNRIEKQAEEYRLRLQAFSNVVSDRAYTIDELADELSKTPNETPVPNEHRKKSVVKMVKNVLVFIAVWIPFVLALGGFINDLTTYAYPQISAAAVIFTLLTVIPSITILTVTKLKPNINRFTKRIILCLCAVAIPFSFVMPYGIVTRSETTDFRNYRDFDSHCLANRNKVFNEVFPMWPHYFENVEKENGEWETVYLDAKYYYQFIYGLDYTYDIYAEWYLEDKTFVAEVERVKAVFEKAVADKTYGYKFVEMEVGEFSCLILYRGNDPFQEVTDSYVYLIFAYGEKTNTVRYVYCNSLENGADRPYYLQLEW